MRNVTLAMVMALGIVACADGQAQPRLMSEPTQPQQSSVAAQDISSAGVVVEGCRDFIARSGSLSSAYIRGLCAGKVEAVAVFASGICFPSEATVGQMIRVVTRYIDQHPARLHENFMLLARDAMREAWPCRR